MRRTVYEITWRSGPAVMLYKKLYRAPAAHDALYSAVYEMLKSYALLDTMLGHRLADEATKAEVSPPAHGYCRFQRFALGGNYLDSVELSVHRY